MTIPTEPIGSIPRPLGLIEAVTASGDDEDPKLNALYDAAIRDTIARFEATGSPVISDGEQRNYHNSGRTPFTVLPILRPMASRFLLPRAITARCTGSHRDRSL